MEHQKIFFEHENEFEGGYGIESAWAVKEGDFYKLDNILFFAKEYSLGDIVSVEEREGDLYVTSLIHESGHSTIRILFENEDILKHTREYLDSKGCASEISNVKLLIAVDIPPNINYSELKIFLDMGEKDKKWTYEEACIAH